MSSQPKKPFHHRNGSDELDVFEAARYFSGATENISCTHKNVSGQAKISNNSMQKYGVRPIGRMSLDMPTHRGDSVPLKAMLMENPMMINKEKKFKQPSSPGGKLAHFLNSLFNLQTSSKKSKSKTKSTKDEDESPSSWRRKRRSSISHFRSANSNSSSTTTTTATATATIMSDSRSPFSTSASSAGFRTPPPYHIAHTPTKTTSYRDPRSYSYLKPPPNQITEISINGNLRKIENFDTKSDFSDKNVNSRYGLVEKENIYDDKQEEHHPHKYVSRKDIKEFKRFIDEDGADSDSSSDLFELENYDLGYFSSGLPVYETTHVDSIKRGPPISS